MSKNGVVQAEFSHFGAYFHVIVESEEYKGSLPDAKFGMPIHVVTQNEYDKAIEESENSKGFFETG